MRTIEAELHFRVDTEVRRGGTEQAWIQLCNVDVFTGLLETGTGPWWKCVPNVLV